MPAGAAAPAAVLPPPGGTVVSRILEQHFRTYQRAFVEWIREELGREA